MSNSLFGLFKDLGGYFAERKRYLIAPILIILVLMALFAIGAEIPVITPFLYALF